MSVTQSRDSTGSFLGVGQMISLCRVVLNFRSGTAYTIDKGAGWIKRLGGGLMVLFRNLSEVCSYGPRRFVFRGLFSTDYSDERASMLKGVADALMADYANSRELDAIEEAISVYEQVLQFRPLGHKRRDEAVCDFGEALYAFCRFNGTDDSRAHRTLVLLREAVQLRPPNPPSRDRPSHSLARALFFIEYEQRSGNLAALTECIMLNRECLQLRKVDHPGRADALSDLAVALLRSFERCGDPTLILESIDMNREALQLRKPGHPLHAASLNNLAMALRRLASLQGDLDALAVSVSLLREAVELHPRWHPLRFYALGNLANSLHTRYQLQALPAALLEAIALRREACELFPASHPEWWGLITHLAESLVADFRHRRDGYPITEAITLLRQAVLLRPVGHDHRHLSLGNLVEALLAQFDEFRDIACLQEAITLQREVLDLRTQGHMQRLEALHRLGHMLSRPEPDPGPRRFHYSMRPWKAARRDIPPVHCCSLT